MQAGTWIDRQIDTHTHSHAHMDKRTKSTCFAQILVIGDADDGQTGGSDSDDEVWKHRQQCGLVV